MKKEEGWRMYTEINQLKNLGLNKSQIARGLSISRPTLDKYLEMSQEEFEEFILGVQERSKKADLFVPDHNKLALKNRNKITLKQTQNTTN